MTRRRRRTRRRNRGQRRTRRPPRRLALLLLALLIAGASGGLTLGVGRAGLAESFLPDLSKLPGLPDWGAALRGPRFRLAHVDFLGLRTVTTGELMRRGALGVDVALIDVDPAAVCEGLEEHPRVAECTAARIPPNRLIVAVRERVPVAVLGRGPEGMDASGARFRLPSRPLPDLPRVDGSPQSALPLLLAARDAGLDLDRVDVRKSGEWTFRPAGAAVNVRAYGDARKAVRDWVRVRDSGLLETHAPGEVDLRFRGSAVLRKLRNQGGK